MRKIILAVAIAASSFSVSAFDMEPWGVTGSYIAKQGYSSKTNSCALASIIGMKACGFTGFKKDMQNKGKKGAVIAVLEVCNRMSDKEKDRHVELGAMWGTYPSLCPAR